MHFVSHVRNLEVQVKKLFGAIAHVCSQMYDQQIKNGRESLFPMVFGSLVCIGIFHWLLLGKLTIKSIFTCEIAPILCAEMNTVPRENT